VIRLEIANCLVTRVHDERGPGYLCTAACLNEGEVLPQPHSEQGTLLLSSRRRRASRRQTARDPKSAHQRISSRRTDSEQQTHSWPQAAMSVGKMDGTLGDLLCSCLI